MWTIRCPICQLTAAKVTFHCICGKLTISVIRLIIVSERTTSYVKMRRNFVFSNIWICYVNVVNSTLSTYRILSFLFAPHFRFDKIWLYTHFANLVIWQKNWETPKNSIYKQWLFYCLLQAITKHLISNNLFFNSCYNKCYPPFILFVDDIKSPLNVHHKTVNCIASDRNLWLEAIYVYQTHFRYWNGLLSVTAWQTIFPYTPNSFNRYPQISSITYDENFLFSNKLPNQK